MDQWINVRRTKTSRTMGASNRNTRWAKARRNRTMVTRTRGISTVLATTSRNSIRRIRAKEDPGDKRLRNRTRPRKARKRTKPGKTEDKTKTWMRTMTRRTGEADS